MAGLDDRHRRRFERIPEVHNALIGIPPAGNYVRQVVFWDAHFQSAHCDERTGAALITQRQFSDLALLPQGVFGVALLNFFQRDAEHLARRRLVDFAVGPEHFQPPLLSREPRDDAGFDGAEVSVHQLVAFGRHERRADELGQGIRHGAVEEPQLVLLLVPDGLTSQRELPDVGAREILNLHETARPAACAVGSVELKQPSYPAIGAHSGLDSVVLLGAGLTQLLPDFKHPVSRAGHSVAFQHSGNRVFPQISDGRVSGLFQPRRELGDAVRVFQPGDGDCLLHEPVTGLRPDFQSAAHHAHVHRHASGVDEQVGLPLFLDVIRHWKGRQPALDLLLGGDVAQAVGLEQIPLIRVMLRQVAVPSTV